MKSNRLVRASMTLLYDGMITPHDIYNADANILLIRQGHTLRMSQIESIRRINGGRDIIQVTGETQKILLEHNLSCELVSQASLEKECGYTGIKDETMNLLKEIAYTQTVPQDALNTVADDLSHHLEITKPDIILGLINALAPVDEYLQRHCVNVSLLNGLIGKWLGLPKENVDLLILIGLVHDCGKALIPPQILNAPRKLTLAEFDIITSHPVFGYDLLTDFPDAVRFGVRAHHEKYDGRGYLDGLSGNDIPLEARITAISDIYDAMVSHRAYKDARCPFHVTTHLRKLRQTGLDPRCVDAFVKNMPNELIDKPVMLSNGEIGVIHAIDHYDLQYPYIRTGSEVVKSDENLYCKAMYLGDIYRPA